MIYDNDIKLYEIWYDDIWYMIYDDIWNMIWYTIYDIWYMIWYDIWYMWYMIWYYMMIWYGYDMAWLFATLWGGGQYVSLYLTMWFSCSSWPSLASPRSLWIPIQKRKASLRSTFSFFVSFAGRVLKHLFGTQPFWLSLSLWVLLSFLACEVDVSTFAGNNPHCSEQSCAVGVSLRRATWNKGHSVTTEQNLTMVRSKWSGKYAPL